MTNFKCLLLANLLVFTSMTVFGQVKIIPSGKTIVGNERAGNDYNNEVTQEFMGLGTDPYRIGGKITIGDYGSGLNGGANVFIAEAYGWDTDALELHGKNGIFFSVNGTSGAGGTILGAELSGYGDLSVTRYIYSQGSLVSSDIRLKKNIKNMNGMLAAVTKLQGLTYDFIGKKEDSTLAILNRIVPKDDKDKRDLDKAKKEYESKKSDNINQMGFSAQEVQKIFPQCVKTDANGFLAVNYISLIPVLVESLKEQQAVIDAQKAEMDAMKKDMAAIKLKLGIK
jgi:Chaperone of endosialidase